NRFSLRLRFADTSIRASKRSCRADAQGKNFQLRLWGEIGYETTARRACCGKGGEIVVDHLAGLSALLPLQSHHREIWRADPGDFAGRQYGIGGSDRVVVFFEGAPVSGRACANQLKHGSIPSLPATGVHYFARSGCVVFRGDAALSFFHDRHFSADHFLFRKISPRITSRSL